MSTVIQAAQDGHEHTPDYEMGFWSGAIHAFLTRRCILSEPEQALKAYEYFMRETKLGATWLGDFVRGWLAGYDAYFLGIV